MKKDLGVIFGLFLLVFILLLFGGGFTSTVFLEKKDEATPQATPADGLIDLSVRELKIKSEIANNDEARRKGLGKRDSLALDRGLLFVFDKPAFYTFWMKDMKFAIDIIWLDEGKKIVHIVQNVPPEPGKKDSELTRYTSPVMARYVLEINAGLTSLQNLQLGDVVNFEI